MDLSKYNSTFSRSNKLRRLIWNTAYWVLFRPFNLEFFRRWRIFVLKMFGCKTSNKASVYASARIWAPWNLELKDYATIGPKVDCYNQGRISIGRNSVISQKTYLCASSHDYRKEEHPLILKPIVIEDRVWVAADAFIGPGVHIAQGAVVGARACVFKDVQPWSVVRGNPAEFIKKREMI